MPQLTALVGLAWVASESSMCRRAWPGVAGRGWRGWPGRAGRGLAGGGGLGGKHGWQAWQGAWLAWLAWPGRAGPGWRGRAGWQAWVAGLARGVARFSGATMPSACTDSAVNIFRRGAASARMDVPNKTEHFFPLRGNAFWKIVGGGKGGKGGKRI